MPVIRRVFKVGNALVSNIPKEIRLAADINRGDYLCWYFDDHKHIMVEKLTPEKHPGFFILGSGWLKRGKQK